MMHKIINHLKNVVRYLSPFHKSKVITHHSLKNAYKRHKEALDAPTNNHLDGLLNNLLEQEKHDIRDQDGFLITTMRNSELLHKATDYCRKAWPKDYIERTVSKPSKQNTLLPVHIDIRDPRNAVIKDLVMADEILASAANYLGDIPVLYGAAVWYCPNRDAEDMVGSQLFHCDREDHKQIKVFVPIDEITADCGPTTCVSAEATQKFYAHRKGQGLTLSLKNRFEDDEVHTHGSASEHAMIGSPGTLGFVDTTNCLHYGSRPANDGKYHMVLHYLSPFSPKLQDHINPSVLSGGLEDIVLSFEDKSSYLREPVQ